MRDPERHLTDNEFAQLLTLLDHPVPRVDATQIMTRVRKSRTKKSAMLAAAALLFAATIATAAVPGTALHDLVRTLFEEESTAVVNPHRGSRVQREPPAAAPRGIAFAPRDHATIVFRAEQSSGELYVRVDSSSSVKITATGDGDARYELTPDGAEVENAGSTASYEIVIPAALAHATVRVNGRVMSSKEGAELVCNAKRASTGRCVVALQP